MIMMNMDGEGVGDVRDYFRKKLLQMKVLKPTEVEAKELQEEAAAQQPSASDQYALASAEAEKARAAKAMADAQLAGAKTEKTQVDTVQVAVDTDLSKQAHVLDAIDRLQPPTPE